MSSLHGSQSQGAAPSVSSEQWRKYALSKMSSGYLLIISSTRNYARFYRGNGELENCSYRIARRLLLEGLLEEVGPHVKGTLYQLSESYRTHVGLAQIAESQMGVVQVIEEEDEEGAAVGYELEDRLTDEAIESGSEEEGGLNSVKI